MSSITQNTSTSTLTPPPKKSDILHHPLVRSALPFINGGLAGMFATAVIQPIDMVKVRIQLAGEGARGGTRPGPFKVAKDIVASGKVLDLYSGLSAGLLRQAVYTTARMGIFHTIQSSLAAKARSSGKEITFIERSLAGLTAGGIAAVIGTPADVALIRMQSDGLRPITEDRKSVV